MPRHEFHAELRIDQLDDGLKQHITDLFVSAMSAVEAAIQLSTNNEQKQFINWKVWTEDQVHGKKKLDLSSIMDTNPFLQAAMIKLAETQQGKLPLDEPAPQGESGNADTLDPKDYGL